MQIIISWPRVPAFLQLRAQLHHRVTYTLCLAQRLALLHHVADRSPVEAKLGIIKLRGLGAGNGPAGKGGQRPGVCRRVRRLDHPGRAVEAEAAVALQVGDDCAVDAGGLVLDVAGKIVRVRLLLKLCWGGMWVCVPVLTYTTPEDFVTPVTLTYTSSPSSTGMKREYIEYMRDIAGFKYLLLTSSMYTIWSG